MNELLMSSDELLLMHYIYNQEFEEYKSDFLALSLLL